MKEYNFIVAMPSQFIMVPLLYTLIYLMLASQHDSPQNNTITDYLLTVINPEWTAIV